MKSYKQNPNFKQNKLMSNSLSLTFTFESDEKYISCYSWPLFLFLNMGLSIELYFQNIKLSGVYLVSSVPSDTLQ